MSVMWEGWQRFCRAYNRAVGIVLMITGPLIAIASLLFLGSLFSGPIVFGLVIAGIGFVVYITSREKDKPS